MMARRLLIAWLPAIFAAQGLHAQVADVPPANAASDASVPGASGSLEEVVVTAQKRAQNLQNVPIAITAFTAQALQNRGTTDILAAGSIGAHALRPDSGRARQAQARELG